MNEAKYRTLAEAYEARLADQEQHYPGYWRRWRGMAAVLLGHGGRLVVPPLVPDPHVDAVLGRGRVWPGAGARLRLGEPNACHANAARLWLAEQAATVVVGYALHRDLWVQHTWALDEDDVLVETTAGRDAYFGYELTETEALVFAAGNLEEAVLAAAVTGGGRAGRVARQLLASAPE